MKKIGLLSDTHGDLDERLYRFFEDVDEIWHAGDIGNMEIAGQLAGFRPLVAVTGNIDGNGLRQIYPDSQRFLCEETDVWMTHIGGYPGHYSPGIREEIRNNPPGLFVCGHSHILRIMYDRELNFLCVNPGAAGKYGFHKVRTALRFVVDGKNIRDMEVWQSEKFS